MRSGADTYNGKQFFYAHYEYLSTEAVRAEVDGIKRLMANHAAGDIRSVLIDVRGTLISPVVLNMFKEVTGAAKGRYTKIAIIGITGPRRVFLEIMGKFSSVPAVPFDDIEQAKAWLVS